MRRCRAARIRRGRAPRTLATPLERNKKPIRFDSFQIDSQERSAGKDDEQRSVPWLFSSEMDAQVARDRTTRNLIGSR